MVSNIQNEGENYTYKELGECIELIIDHRGKTPKKLGSDWVNNGIKTISAKNVNGGRLVNENSIRCVTYDIYKKWMKEDIKRGDCLLVSEGATLGEYLYWDNEYPIVLGQRIFCIRTKSEILSPKYFYAYMTSSEFQSEIIGRATGSSVAGLRQTEVLKLKVKILPMNEQIFIGDVLYNLNKKIELNHQINQTLESMAQAIFKRWFVDFEPVKAKIAALESGEDAEGVTRAAMRAISGKTDDELDKMEGGQPENYAKLKTTAELFPAAMQDSELGEVPEGWEVGCVGDVVKVVGGGTPSTKNFAFWDDGTHCWTTPKDLSGISSPVLLDTARKITDAGLAKISCGLLPAGTFLLSSRAPVGYTAIAQMPLAVNQGYIAIPPGGQLSSIFLLHWTRINLDTIKGRASGTTFQEISKKNFRPIKIIVPTAEILTHFDRISGRLFERIVENERESRSLTEIRDALLPKLMSGKIRVTNIR